MTIAELVQPNKPDISEWKKLVLARDSNTCINCEQIDHVAAAFIVPPEAGGRIKLANGVTLCRDCRISTESARALPIKLDNKTPINFLVSKELHENAETYAKESNFGNLSSMIRHMIQAYIQAPETFSDLYLWQDGSKGSLSEIKINLWCQSDIYEAFKRICQSNNISFTNAFKGLMLMAMDIGARKS